MKYVVYYRVSTKKQGESGLGLEAQERDVKLYLDNYVRTDDYEILNTFTDIESGTSDLRKGFNEALALAEQQGAELLVAKLDRVSRKVSSVALAMERVKVRVACMPFAENFQLHLYAALAEQEREFISQRTKAALQAAQARGVKLGAANPKWQETNKGMLKNLNKRKNSKARSFAEGYRKQFEMMVSMKLPLDPMAQKMNELNHLTASGKKWTAGGVRNALGYLGLDGRNAEERCSKLVC